MKTIKIVSILYITLFINILSAAETDSSEVISRRNYYSKTYQVDDSTFTTRISSAIIHYKDRKGNFKEVDKTIIPSADSLYDYEVTKGIYKAWFKADLQADYPISYENRKGGTFKLQPFALVYMSPGISHKPDASEYQVIAKIQHAEVSVEGNVITYHNAFNGVDIRYTYKQKKLKEEIILSPSFRTKLPAPGEYSDKKNSSLAVLSYVDFGKDSTELNFTDVDSLGRKRKLRMQSFSNYEGDSKLHFYRGSHLLFSLAEDVAYARNDSLDFKPLKMKRKIWKADGRRVLATAISYKKLQKFPEGPIIIDPTIETNFDAVEDVWLENTWNKNGYSMLLIGRDQAGAKKRSIIKFDLSSIPTHATVLDASLGIYYFSRAGRSSNYPWVDRPIRVCALTRNWIESQATRDKATSSVNWSNQYAEGNYYTGPYAQQTVVLNPYQWYNFDVTDIVYLWDLGIYVNYGFLLKATNEDTPGYDVRFRSSEASSNQPYLDVTWKRPFKKQYYLKDHLGNIRVTVDESGSVVTADDYYPFGMQMPGRSYNVAFSGNQYKYNGKELDDENGLDWYSYGARYYDAEVARWHAVDPLSQIYPSMSPYSYAANNPINLLDPNGMSLLDPKYYLNGTELPSEMVDQVSDMVQSQSEAEKKKQESKAKELTEITEKIDTFVGGLLGLSKSGSEDAKEKSAYILIDKAGNISIVLLPDVGSTWDKSHNPFTPGSIEVPDGASNLWGLIPNDINYGTYRGNLILAQVHSHPIKPGMLSGGIEMGDSDKN